MSDLNNSINESAADTHGKITLFEQSADALYKYDFILSSLFKIFEKFGAGKSSLVLFIVPVAVCFVIGGFENTLHNIAKTPATPDGLIGVIKDYTLYALWAVILFSLYFYYKFSKAAKKFLTADIKFILDTKKFTRQEISKTDSFLHKILAPEGIFKKLYLLFIALFIFFWVLNLLKGFTPVKYYGSDIWHSWNHPWGFVFLKFTNLIYSTLFLAVFFFRFVSGLFAFSVLFHKISKKNGFIIKPLSPDNSGGLKILSNLSIYFMYMVLPFFLIYLSLILRGSALLPGQQISLLALVFLLFITFFLPLGSVHNAMKRAKEAELNFVARAFTILNKDVKKRMKEKTFGATLNEEIESLEKIDFLYTKTEKMPVWPFNLDNLTRLVLAALVPVLLFIIDHLDMIPVLKNLFSQE